MIVVIIIVVPMVISIFTYPKLYDNLQVQPYINYTGMTSGYLQIDSIFPSQVSVPARSTATVNITITSTALVNTHSIDDITTPGFTLISVTPTLPYYLSPGQTVTLTIVIQTPSGYGQTGTLEIEIYTS